MPYISIRVMDLHFKKIFEQFGRPYKHTQKVHPKEIVVEGSPREFPSGDKI